MRWIIRRNRTHEFEEERSASGAARTSTRTTMLDSSRLTTYRFRSALAGDLPRFSALSRLQLRCFVHKMLQTTQQSHTQGRSRVNRNAH
jgi:hypothetical protein